MPEINYAAALPVLRKGRNRIAKGWNQGCFARTAEGKEIRPYRPEAVCWCIWGAIIDSEGDGDWDPAERSAYFALRSITKEDIPDWNDTPGRTQAEVLALFDRAIAECEEKAR